MKRQPIVLVPACHRMLGDHPNHTVGKKYTDADELFRVLPRHQPALNLSPINMNRAVAAMVGSVVP